MSEVSELVEDHEGCGGKEAPEINKLRKNTRRMLYGSLDRVLAWNSDTQRKSDERRNPPLTLPKLKYLETE